MVDDVRRDRSPLMLTLAIIAALLVVPAPTLKAQVAGPSGRIVFASNADGDHDIYTMAPDGTDVRNLTTAGETGDGWHDVMPSWSPDGASIAFMSDRNVGSDIFVMGADGSGLRPVTNFGSNDSVSSPDWSPEGTRLVFAGQRESEEINGNEDLDIYVVGVNGGGLRNITDAFEATPGQYDWSDKDPDWSPVEDKIVFSSARIVEGASYEGAFWRIVTMDPDGSDQVVVSDPDDPGNDPWPDDVPNHDEMPKWSPDGAWITFATHQQPEQQWDIQIVRGNGTSQQNVLPDENWEDVFPSWAPSGTEILFTSNRTGDHTRAIYSVDVSSFVASNATARITVEAAAASSVHEVGGVGRSEDPDWYARPVCTIRGTAAGERIDGTPGRDVICAGDGNDTIAAAGGHDVVLGGKGDDTLLGSTGADRIEGGSGSDTVSYQAAAGGIDASLGGRRATGQGFDALIGVENLIGSAFDDLMTGSAAANRLSALGGADTVRGSAGNDVLIGGGGADTLIGGEGIDRCTDVATTSFSQCEA